MDTMEVKNHWIRILILISYFFLVFVVSRILDLVLWYHHGYLPTDLVDPILLNVRQLKQLLDSRGVSYTGVLEKQQLVQLLNDSAHIVKGEVDELNAFSNSSDRLYTHKPPPSSHFTGGSHFNEKVEDTKDSVWLVQVLPAKRTEPLLDDYSWRLLKHKLAPFAIQTGVFDCAMDRKLCVRRNWQEPILLLALPRGNRPKDHIIIRTSNTPKINMIVKWVKEQLSSRVTKISSLSQLEEQWLNPSTSDDSVRVILLSHLLHTPLFFAALSIKFSGRIKFGMFSVRRDEDSSSSNNTPFSSSGVGSGVSPGKLPLYLVVTPEGTHHYGHAPAQHHSLLHMNLFLRLVLPELNDLFLLALLLTNMLAVIDICQLQGATRWHYLIRTSCLVVTYNLLLFFLSLVLYNLSSPPPLPLSPLLFLLRTLNFSYLGALIRSDLLRLYANPLWFTGTFLLYGFLMGRRFPRSETSSEWTFLGNSFILNSLFRPSERPSRTFTSDVHFELRFEQFILSGAAPRAYNVPNLWLQTSPRVDYISDLPVFEFRGWRPCPHKDVEVLLKVMDGEMRPQCLASARASRNEDNADSSALRERSLCSRRDMESECCAHETPNGRVFRNDGSGNSASSRTDRVSPQNVVGGCASTGPGISLHADNCDMSSVVIDNIRFSELVVHQKKNTDSSSSSQNPSTMSSSSRVDSQMSKRVTSDNASNESSVNSAIVGNNPKCSPCENTHSARNLRSSDHSRRMSSAAILCRTSEQVRSMSRRDGRPLSMSSIEDRALSTSSTENRTRDVSSIENRATCLSPRENRTRDVSSIEDRALSSSSREDRTRDVSSIEDRLLSTFSRENRIRDVSSIEDRALSVSSREDRTRDVSSIEDRTLSTSSRENRKSDVSSIEDRPISTSSRENRTSDVSSIEDRARDVSSIEDRARDVSSIEDRTRGVSSIEDRARDVSSTEDRATCLSASGHESPPDDTESCDYLECRLIRAKDCAICLECYAPRALLLALPCAHHFHKTCILSWLQRGHPQCPVCRWPAYKQKYEFSY